MRSHAQAPSEAQAPARTQQTHSAGAKPHHSTGKAKAHPPPAEEAAGSNGVAPAPQMVASQAEALAALLGDPRASVQALDYYRVPLFLLPIYQAAAAQYGVPWQVLAAINEVETDYGNDLNVSTAGAVGWMQFMPSTWLQYGVDVQETGYADPYNPVDAVFAAARYLEAAGVSHSLSQGIFAYNHSQSYVQSVLLRAKLIAHYPSSVIAALTGLAEGQMPVAGALATGEQQLPAPSSSVTSLRASGASRPTEPGSSGLAVAPPPSSSARAIPRRPADQRFVDLSASAHTPVLAVQDGKVLAIGRSKALGRYLVLRDVFGDVFTYSGLGSIAKTYPLVREGGTIPGAALAGAAAAGDPVPSQPATAGRQPSVTLHAGSGQHGAIQYGESATEVGEALGKVRMYAHPHNRYARAALAAASAAGKLARRAPLRVGSVVSQGDVLGSMSVTQGASSGQMRLSISPAGDPGTVEAEPVLQSWRQLHAALHPPGARRSTGLLGATAGDAFLLGRTALQHAVLSDPGIHLSACTQQDVSIGAVGARPLATLVFLSRSALKPTLAAIPCERRVKGGFSAPGSPVRGSRQSLQLTAVNGVPIAGHQGPRSIADLTIRTLLTLNGRFAPSEIASLMRYPGAPQTIASRHRSRSILVVFSGAGAGTGTGTGAGTGTGTGAGTGTGTGTGAGTRASGTLAGAQRSAHIAAANRSAATGAIGGS
ncbi:MAG: lytic murein transglycosylase, partial [Solirubrobacteraceae bacterium]